MGKKRWLLVPAVLVACFVAYSLRFYPEDATDFISGTLKMTKLGAHSIGVSIFAFLSGGA